MVLDIIKHPLFPPHNPVRSRNFPFSPVRRTQSQAHSSFFGQCYIKQWLKSPFLLSSSLESLLTQFLFTDTATPSSSLSEPITASPFLLSHMTIVFKLQSLFFLLFSHAKLPMHCLLSVHCCSTCCNAIPLSSSRLSSYSTKRSCR